MFKKVLAALDGSELSEAILPHLERLVRHIDIDLRLLRVTGARARDAREEQAYLDRVAVREAGRFPSIDTLVLRGDPARKLMDHARSEKFDLIALATHGRSGVGRVLFGSVADELLRRSRVPVYVARAKASRPPFRRILVPLDGSERSASVLPLAGDVAQASGAKIVLLNVRAGDKAEQSLSASLTGALDTLAEREIPARLRVRQGDPVEEILAAAQEADLVAIATHGRTGAARARFGSVTAAVLRDSPVPLLVQRSSGFPNRRPYFMTGRVEKV